MKNLDKTLWIKRIFMVLMDICIVILTSIDCKIRIQSFGCTKVLYWRCMEFIAGNVSDRDYCILCISFV